MANTTKAPVTRFYDPMSGRDGPVSGAIGTANVQFTGAATGTAYTQDLLTLPAGMKIFVTDALMAAASITNTATIKIGTPADDDSLVASASLTTTLGALTLITTGLEIGQTSTPTRVQVIVTNSGSANSAFTDAVVSLAYYVSQAPTNAFLVGQGYF